jgi:chemotaxis signal transduction protein
MNANDTHVSETATGMRLAFDRSFSQPRTTDIAVIEKLLAVRAGSHPYLVRLSEVSGLFVDKKITWLPSPLPELLGLAGLRSTILPIYDLGMLLGSARAAAPRWLLVTATTPVGFAFDHFDGYLSVRPDDIVPEIRAETRERHVLEVVRAIDHLRPLVSLASVLESIQKRALDSSEKER